MSLPTRAQHPLWDWVPLESVAVLVGLVVALVAPTRALDEAFWSWSLRVAATSQPSATALAVPLTGEALSDGRCAERATALLQGSGARALVLLPPAEEVCRATPKDLPTLVADVATLRRDRAGRVLGLLPGGNWEKLSVPVGGWAAPSPESSVPTAGLAELLAGRTPREVLQGRIVVLGLELPPAAGQVGKIGRAHV